MIDEREFHFKKRTDKTYVSPRIDSGAAGTAIRIASKVIDSAPGLIEIKDKGEIVLRGTAGGRQGITAKFYENSRGVFTLTIQKFTTTGPSKEYHFSFVGSEINTLLQFIRNIKRFPFTDANKVNISDAEFDQIVLNSQQARRILFQIMRTSSLKSPRVKSLSVMWSPSDIGAPN